MTSVIVPPERTIENSERQGVFISYSQHRPSTSGDFSGGSALATEIEIRNRVFGSPLKACGNASRVPTSR